MAQPSDSAYRMESICVGLPEVVEPHHGYHRDCYQRFTANPKRLQFREEHTEPSYGKRIKRRESDGSDKILFTQDCIFCNKYDRKKIKVRESWTTKALSSFEYGGGVTIVREAERKKDEKLLNRICGFELFACEAKYHKSCRTQYLQKPEKWRSKSDESAMLQNKLEEAHTKTFKHVCEILEDEVIDRKEAVKLSNLRKEYAKIPETTEFANPDYRGEKLKTRIGKSEQFKEKLSFCPLGDDTRFYSYIIFNRNIDIGDAIEESYKLGSSNIISKAGFKLQNIILGAFPKSEETPWPPTADSLQVGANNIPKQLKSFLTILLCGKENSMSTKVNHCFFSWSRYLQSYYIWPMG